MRAAIQRSIHASLVMLVIAFHLQPADAGNFFGDVWGVVTDPLKLRKSSQTLADSVDRTLIQLQQLEGKADYDVKERLEQVRSILKEAVSGSEEVIKRATNSMLEVEGRINEDALRLIYSTKCAIDVTLKTTAEESLSALLNQVAEAKPSVQFLGITFLDVRTRKLTITNPNVAYQSARAETFEILNRELRNSSPSTRIFFAYQTLQSAAKYALCYYTLNNGPAGQKLWVEEINELERLLTPWTVVLIPDIGYR